MSFENFAFNAAICANIKKLGYEAPTPIQREAIPHVAQGRDLMGLAQTGTGKTAAFLLPIIDRFLKNPKPVRGSARALVIAPTRELAEQIHESAKDYAKGLRFRSVTVYGGVGMGPQTANLRRGADLVVACPGRLLDHVNQRHADLSGVEVLVLDEADHMFDMGFLPDIKKILALLPPERQTLLFSATMPESIRELAGQTLNDPVLVRVGRQEPVQTIEQCLCPVPQHLKTKLLLTILGNAGDGSVLIFARTKHRAKRLAEQLTRYGHAAACIQGNLSQNQRQKAMDGFRSGAYRVLVATDIAARGIDVSSVAHVINYDLPDTPETYTHRVGRTGRAEREGQAWSLVTSEDVSMIRAIERLLGKSIERRKIEGFDYAASAPERDREFERPPLAPRGGYRTRSSQAGEAQPRGYGAQGASSRFAGQGGQEASQGAGARRAGHGGYKQPGERSDAGAPGQRDAGPRGTSQRRDRMAAAQPDAVREPGNAATRTRTVRHAHAASSPQAPQQAPRAAASNDESADQNWNRDGVPGGFYGSVTDYGFVAEQPRRPRLNTAPSGDAGRKRPRRTRQDRRPG